MLRRLQITARAFWRRLPVQFKVKAARSVQPKFTVSSTAIIINDASEVLLLEHVFGRSSGWGLPGGFLKSKEEAEAAVRREIREEIGLELDNVQPYFAKTHRTHVEIFFIAKPVGEPRVNSLEIIGFKWLRASDLPRDMSGTQRRLIEEVLAGRV